MKKKFALLVMLVAIISLLPINHAFAATSQSVTVTATPSFISISNAPGTWTINGITGDSRIDTSTTYYSNPLGDTTSPSDPVTAGECQFTITNTSNIAIDITVNFEDFTGGDAMTNGNSGSAGASTFGAYSYHEGMTYSTGKVVAKATGSGALKTNLAASTNLKWGVAISTQTDDWSSGDAMTSTVTVTATAN